MAESGDPKSKKAGTIVKLVAAAATAGGLVAVAAMPGLGSLALGARKVAHDFNTMDVEKMTRAPSEKSIVYAADGRPIVTFFNEFREPVRLDQVSPVMQRAIIAIEDSRFYEHGPLDVKGTLRALSRNQAAGGTVEGGSTLTQQYAKNLLLANARTKADRKRVTATTAIRKIRELRHAVLIEKTMSKDKILEGYLNIAYFGAGAYGVEAAAKRYFNKRASALNLNESALLAGLTKNPVAYDPTRHPKAAKERRKLVLNRMAELGLITQVQSQKAAKEKIKLKPTQPQGGCSTSKVSFYCLYVRNEMIKILAGGKLRNVKDAVERLQRGGYTIRTSFDWHVQRAAQRSINNQTSPQSTRVAAEAITEIGTGHVKAIVTSKKFGGKKPNTTINLAADVAHGGGVGVSAGSTFKIFTLMAAQEKGLPLGTSFYSPGRMTIGGFRTCSGKKLPLWNVGNAGDGEAGRYNMRSGTTHSVNTYYAQLQRAVGLCRAVKMAHRWGMRRSDGGPLQQVPAQVLGSNEIDMVHLSAAFAGIANHGKYCRPTVITEVTGPNGQALPLPKNNCKQIVKPRIADTTMSIMRGVFGSQGTAKKVRVPGPGAAGKTGTCENFSCAVFAGSQGKLAAAVAYWDMRGGFRHPVWGTYGAGKPASMWSWSLRGANKARREVVKVPKVDGLPVGAALAVLGRAGFKASVSRRPADSQAPKGAVAYISPSKKAEKGGTITVYLSTGGGE